MNRKYWYLSITVPQVSILPIATFEPPAYLARQLRDKYRWLSTVVVLITRAQSLLPRSFRGEGEDSYNFEGLTKIAVKQLRYSDLSLGDGTGGGELSNQSTPYVISTITVGNQRDSSMHLTDSVSGWLKHECSIYYHRNFFQNFFKFNLLFRYVFFKLRH